MTSLRDLAEYMADFFSADAAMWPVNALAGPSRAPVRVAFRWFGPFIPPVGRELLHELTVLLAAPYRSPERADAMQLQVVEDEDDADAVIAVAEVPQDGQPGVAYEIALRNGDVYPGWFALTAG